ncbi:alpha/beta fold hydrolase [Magnetospirillum sp. UT-4]|uniref:alpha/beta fold hydrolase n=1 Tax=Magnetospirillum sp. UT-4 TaxID=2681467 RepID=UPI0013816017|nr:alpha/beta hydrolase [Magnetospirillum sp. UT-4]CAA7613904.1 Hydrolases or acyltransferases (Alpha/beta hydrolase superfamily) [Magnetospirillum sp. UT-4]
MTPRSLYLTLAGLEVHVSAWGDRDAPALVMWHGLARHGRDFDTAARHFAGRFRVLCPDTIGRGLSAWSPEPARDYTIPTYCRQALELLDQLGIERCAWVGTSMGGLVGMGLAGTEAGRHRISRLVLNDIAPRLNAAAIERIKAYVSVVPDFATMAEFEQFLRAVYVPFGALSDDEWRAMAETSARRRDNGRLSCHYDPAVMRVFADSFDDFDMWDVYDAISCPVLALRGEASDLVERAVAEDMSRRGPRAELVHVQGCGHAPYLNTPGQLAVLDRFLG